MRNRVWLSLRVPRLRHESAAQFTNGRVLSGFFIALAVLALLSTPFQSALAQSRTYTLDADFDEGTLDGVNHDPPNSDQLQLSPQATTFPFAWIANDPEGTVSKVNTATGKEVARYIVARPGTNPRPSRTAVDKDGNCWVANRAFNGFASVTQILIEGGVDRNGNGTIETSEDLNNDGVISGAEMLPWGADERVARHYRVGGYNGVARGLTLDAQGFVWVGLYYERRMVKLDPALSTATYTPLAEAYPPELVSIGVGHATYGLALGPNNMLYVATLSSVALEVDPGAASGGTDPPRVLQTVSHTGQNYGIAVDGNGIVWYADVNNARVIRWDPSLGAGGFTYGGGAPSRGRGVTVDFDGNIWMACDQASSVAKFTPASPPTLILSAPAGGANYPIGVGVSADGNIIAVGQNSSSWGKIDKATGATINTGGPQLTGPNPYTYSDFTGSLSRIIGRQGFWTVIYDGATPGQEWGTVSWNSLEPVDTEIGVEVRAADNPANLTSETYVAVTNGVDFSGIFGRYIQIRARLSSDRDDLASPILYDLTVSTLNQPPVALCQDLVVDADENCLGDGSVDDGSYDPDGDPITIVQQPPGPYPLGPTTVTLTVTDSYGASSTCEATVLVVDVTPPVLSGPGCSSPEFGFVSPTGAVVTYEPSATDNCDPSPAVACVPPSGTIYPIGGHSVTCSAVDASGNTDECSFEFRLVPFDVKPQSCPNPLNIKAKGSNSIATAGGGPMSSLNSVLPTAILGTADFDVMMVDLESLRLEGVAPIRSNYADVATPVVDDPAQDCVCTTEGPDGFMDLTLKFSKTDIIDAIGAVANGDEIMLTLTGLLLDGTPFAGGDCVVIRAHRSNYVNTSLLTAGAGREFDAWSYPNPFNAATTITYRLTDDGPVSLVVYNVLGQEVITLVDRDQAAGEHTVLWTGRDASGREVASGMYFYRLQSRTNWLTRKMTLLK